MIKKIKDFFKETKLEMYKVTWPSKQDLISSTIVVVVISIFFAVYLGIVDGLLTVVYRYLVRL